MSKVWILILLSSIGTLLFLNPSEVITAMIRGSHSAVALSINLLAVYGLWLGFFGILEKVGIAKHLARLLHPVVKFLFPGIEGEGEKYISMNISANILGLGNASTPMAIKAINAMSGESEVASTNMIMMVVLSSTSLQLLPTTVIGLRATHGSANPSDFLIPTIIATIVSTIIGVALVKIISNVLKKVKSKSKRNKDIAAPKLPLSAKGMKNI